MARAFVKNWSTFQHYKDRSPPWIKLHRALLDDFLFTSLPIASKALAPLVWLLAAESNDGSFESDPAYLAFRLRWPLDEMLAGLNPLIEKGFITGASGVLAECVQVATPEREGETERETEKRASKSPPFVLPDWLPPDVWQDWHRYRNARKGWTAHARDLSLRRLTELRSQGHDPRAMVDLAIESGWSKFWPPKESSGANREPAKLPRLQA
jgi:hypothetical protein